MVTVPEYCNVGPTGRSRRLVCACAGREAGLQRRSKEVTGERAPREVDTDEGVSDKRTTTDDYAGLITPVSGPGARRTD